MWTDTAIKDLENVVGYIYEDSPSYALAFFETVKEKSKTLDNLYQRGRIVPEYKDHSIREIFIHRYRLIYKIQEKRVIILTFIHGARELND